MTLNASPHYKRNITSPPMLPTNQRIIDSTNDCEWYCRPYTGNRFLWRWKDGWNCLGEMFGEETMRRFHEVCDDVSIKVQSRTLNNIVRFVKVSTQGFIYIDFYFLLQWTLHWRPSKILLCAADLMYRERKITRKRNIALFGHQWWKKNVFGRSWPDSIHDLSD